MPTSKSLIPERACNPMSAAGTGKKNLKLLLAANKRLNRQLLLAIAFIVSLTCALTANAMTDCSVRLASSFTGDIAGTGQYGLFLIYSYTTTGGSVVDGSGYILLSNPAAANISAVAYTAQATGQSVQVRYLNSSGASTDSVCGSTAARSDLVGIWLAT
jgi:hypothetical protein